MFGVSGAPRKWVNNLINAIKGDGWTNETIKGNATSIASFAQQMKSLGCVGDGVTDDITAIENAFATIEADKRVFLFADGTFLISRPIKLKDNTTILIKNATIKLKDASNCNIFISEGATTDPLGSNENIHILGLGNAVIDGNNLGQTFTTEAAMHKIAILFFNTQHYSVKNLTIRNTYFWACSNENGCEDFEYDNIHFEQNRETSNMDGINLRKGCSYATISNITGVCGDDVVALTGITAQVTDDRVNYPNDICKIQINNIMASSAYALFSTVSANECRVFDVQVNNLFDTGEITAQHNVRINATTYGDTLGTVNDTFNIDICNVIGRATNTIRLNGAMKNIRLKNIRSAAGTASVLLTGGKEKKNIVIDGVVTSGATSNILKIADNPDGSISDLILKNVSHARDSRTGDVIYFDDNLADIYNLILSNIDIAQCSKVINYGGTNDFNITRFVVNGLQLMRTGSFPFFLPVDCVVKGMMANVFVPDRALLSVDNTPTAQKFYSWDRSNDITMGYNVPEVLDVDKIIVEDSFDRANATGLGNAETGQAWEVILGAWEILSNEAHATEATAMAVIESSVSDCTVETVFNNVTTNANRLIFRYASTTNFWSVATDIERDQYTVIKMLNNVATAIGTISQEPASGDKVTVVLDAGNIKVYINDVLGYEVTDTSNASATKHGIRSNTVTTPTFGRFKVWVDALS